MSDLIERLRGYDTVFQTAHEAADELERLTKENEELRDALHRWQRSEDVQMCRALRAEEKLSSLRQQTLLEAAEVAEQDTISVWEIPEKLRRMAGVE